MSPNVQWFSLLAVVPVAAGALLLQHYTIGRRGWNRRHYYAVGLATVLGLLLGWAVLFRVEITPLNALALLAAAAVAGLPDWFILAREQRETEQQWQHLIQHNRQLAAHLALLQVAGSSRYYTRTHQLIESIAFIRGGFHQDLQDLQAITGQLEAALGALATAAPTKEDTHAR